jgi:hypothetical protein
MITGKDVANYSLLFLDETLTRKRGEHETIFMPHIVLGRSSRCHVRFGDQFSTVSREHASITVDGSNFVINHNPSASNPTYVNGRAIGASHFLQNGDEIQLSSNGPKMRFNTSALKTSTIGLTSRIGQAMSQAVKPYKTALWIMGLLLLGALGLAGYNMYQNSQMSKELVALNLEKEKVDNEIKELISKGEENSERMKELANRKAQIIYRTNTIEKVVGGENNSSAKVNSGVQDKPNLVLDDSKDKIEDLGKISSCEVTEKEISKVLPKNDVVVIIGKRIEVTYQGKSDEIGVKEFYAFKSPTQLEDRSGLTIGSGFLTENGRLLTCRHVVQPWRYYKTSGEKSDFWKQLNIIEANGGTVVMHFDVLTSDGSQFMAFTSSSAVYSDATDKVEIGGKKKVKIEIFDKKSKIDIPNLEDKTKEPTDRFSDWANIAAEKDGAIQLLKDKSTNIEQGEKLYVLGFSQGLSLQDANRRAEASLSTTLASNNATFNGQIFTSGANYGPGNSGGPAFICVNGYFYCVGIVSAIVGSSNTIIVPVGRVRGSK